MPPKAKYQWNAPCEKCGGRDHKPNGDRGNGRWQFICRTCGKSHMERVEPDLSLEQGGTGPETTGLRESGNYAEVVSDPARDPRTLPSLGVVLKQFKVDLDTWAVEKHVINRWEMGFKQADGEPGHYPLFQVKAWLVRREPVAVEWPQLNGATVRKLKPRNFAISRQLKRRVILPDMQAGFTRDMDTGELEPLHDPLACDVFLRVVQKLQPDGLDAVGDNLDLAEWSDKYIVTPEFYWTTQATIDWLASYLSTLRAYVGPRESDEEFRYLEGNHEKRLFTSIVKNLIAAYKLRPANEPRSDPVFSVPFLLGLRDMLISWHGDYPRNRVWINDNLSVAHSEKLSSKPGQSAGRTIENETKSIIFGHSHRIESAHSTVHRRGKTRVYGAYNCGTLARIDGKVPSNAAEENWQQGFAVVDYEDSGRHEFDVHLVNIYRGRCIFEGKVYEAESDDGLEAAG